MIFSWNFYKLSKVITPSLSAIPETILSVNPAVCQIMDSIIPSQPQGKWKCKIKSSHIPHLFWWFWENSKNRKNRKTGQQFPFQFHLISRPPFEAKNIRIMKKLGFLHNNYFKPLFLFSWLLNKFFASSKKCYHANFIACDLRGKIFFLKDAAVRSTKR